MKRPDVRFYVPCVVAGLLLFAAFPPFDFGTTAAILGWFVLFLCGRLRRGDRAFRQGYIAGVVWLLPGLHWIAPLVAGGWVFTSLWCALFEGLFLWLVAKFWWRTGRGGWVVGAALLHLLTDMLRTHALSGFTWLMTGYAGWQNPVLLGGAELLGVHGSTLAILLVAGGAAEGVARSIEEKGRLWTPLIPAAAVWLVFAGFMSLGAVVKRAPDGPHLALLQANISQRLKEDREADGTPATSAVEWWGRHADLIDEAFRDHRTIDAIVWPETMVPPSWNGKWLRARRELTAEDPVWTILARMSRGRQTLAGVVTIDADRRYRNSVVLVDGEGQPVACQDKQHLAPGGEYIPYLDLLPDSFRRWLQGDLEQSVGFMPDLRAGDGPELLPVAYTDRDGRPAVSQVGALICFESAFPAVSRDLANAGAEVFLNASNYGWFAGTAFMDQARAMCCFRAAETGRPVILSSNNGHSTVIDESLQPRPGLVVNGRDTDVAGVLVVRAPAPWGDPPFLIWGEWAAWFLGLVGLGLGWFGRRPESPRTAPDEAGEAAGAAPGRPASAS